MHHEKIEDQIGKITVYACERKNKKIGMNFLNLNFYFLSNSMDFRMVDNTNKDESKKHIVTKKQEKLVCSWLDRMFWSVIQTRISYLCAVMIL